MDNKYVVQVLDKYFRWITIEELDSYSNAMSLFSEQISECPDLKFQIVQGCKVIKSS